MHFSHIEINFRNIFSFNRIQFCRKLFRIGEQSSKKKGNWSFSSSQKLHYSAEMLSSFSGSGLAARECLVNC